jgi:hypothetical protein
MSKFRNDRRKQQRPVAAPRQARQASQTNQASKYDLSQEREQHRFVADLFTFWWACPDGRCRRRRACAGDSNACFKRYWWLVPEAHKISFNTFVRERVAGMSVQQASRAAAEEIARRADHIARVDAETDARLKARRAARDGK